MYLGELAGVSLKEAAGIMRAAGVRRLRLGTEVEIELFDADTIPAPPPEDPADIPAQDAEPKLGNQCRALGCAETGGWMGTTLCRAHGLAQAGVKS